MTRGPKKWTEEVIERYTFDGRGKGEGDKYQPWIRVAEISSLGRSRRPFGLKTGRQHELLSDVEWNLFLLLEYSPDVVDIREQYPLDRDLTREIAASLGIRHPHYPGTHVPTVMTVDFLVTRIKNGKKVLEVFDTKRTDEAEDPRSLEKLEIQRVYMNGKGIPYYLVFHTTFPLQKIHNIEWMRSAQMKEGEVERFPGLFQEAADKMVLDLPYQQKRSVSLSEYCLNFDHRNGYEPGTGLRAARMLMFTHVLNADLNNPDLSSAPLASFTIVTQQQSPRAAGGW